MDKERLKEVIAMFFSGAFDFQDKSRSFMKKEALDEMDNFMILCFGDLLGIPTPVSYYTLELLPYLAEDLEKWEMRVLKRESVLADRWGDFCC